jgi:hypothetical protein
MRSIGLGAVILILSAFGACAQVINAPVVGGPGGGPFDDACKPGDVMVGFNVTDGKAMDQFAAVCQAQNNGVLVGKNYGLRTWGKEDESIPHLGYWPRCPAGSAITEMQVWVNKFQELDSVAATCSPLRPNSGQVSSLPRTVPMGGKAARNGVSACPNGMIAVGVTGRSGALVDSIGLKCAPLPRH